MLPFLINSNKILDRAVISFFNILREKASWHGPFIPVIVEAFAADAVFGATGITAITKFIVLFFVGTTAHWILLA